jgi:asparagine N-glycosylation enzyme membrane subunit Stt3
MPLLAATPALSVTAAPRHALNVTAAACAGMAVVALVAAAAIDQPLAGVALALGLLLGGANGFLAVRLLGLGVAFAATSLLRLLILTALAIASGFVLGWERAILVAAGMAVAQLVLSGASLREVLRAR